MIIGISGESGSGKSAVCKYLSKKGFYIIDVDCLAKSLYEKIDSEGYKKILKTFGNKILLDSGKINKRYLGRIVFKNKSQMKKLNTIMFPLIYKKLKEIVTILGKDKKLVLDAALLIKTKLQKFVDFTIIITADRETRIKRLLKRKVDSNIVVGMADAVKFTKKDLDKAKLILFNNNDNDLQKIKKELEEFLDKYYAFID